VIPQVDLVGDLGKLSNDPLSFVLYAFPWGEVGTSLEHRDGPEEWQRDFLADVRDQIAAGTKVHDVISCAIREARVSGNGVGKSALVSWLIWWAYSTFPDTKGVVTANTETQLRTKTWAELGKWYNLFIGRELFELTATSLFSKDAAHKLTWRCDAIPWSEHNTVAY